MGIFGLVVPLDLIEVDAAAEPKEEK